MKVLPVVIKLGSCFVLPEAVMGSTMTDIYRQRERAQMALVASGDTKGKDASVGFGFSFVFDRRCCAAIDRTFALLPACVASFFDSRPPGPRDSLF